MKCDICSNEASVYLTQIVNDKMTTVNLCEGCAQAKGVTDATGFGLAEAFIGPTSARADGLVCPACGFTQNQLKKIGRMGCPECYTTFRDGLDTLLASMHKGTEHHGKTPKGIAPNLPAPPPARQRPKPVKPPVDIQKSIQSLRAELQAAVEAERYEDAARLKNEIIRLEEQLTEGQH